MRWRCMPTRRALDKPIKELQDEAIPAMRSAFEQLRGFFHGYDHSAALDAEPVNALRVICEYLQVDQVYL